MVLLAFAAYSFVGPAAFGDNGKPPLVYYAIENEDKTAEVKNTRDAIKKATGTTKEVAYKKNRGADMMDGLAKLPHEGGRIDCGNGIFIAHYSGHGAANPETGEAVIGRWDGTKWSTTTSTQVVAAIVNEVPANAVIVFIGDSCAMGPFHKALKATGRPFVCITASSDTIPQANASASEHVVHALTRDPVTKRFNADLDENGRVSALELAKHVEQRQVDARMGGQTTWYLAGSGPSVTKAVIKNTTETDKAPKKPVKEEAKSENGDVRYNYASESLWFSPKDTIADPALVDDPVHGAVVTFPEFDVTGIGSKETVIFEGRDDVATGAPSFDVTSPEGTFVRGTIPVMTYLPGENYFYGVVQNLGLAGAREGSGLYDPALPDLGSSWGAELNALLDPVSPRYDPNHLFYACYYPEGDFWAATSGLATDATLVGFNGLGVAYPSPELPAALLLILGFALVTWTVRRRMVPNKSLPRCS